MLIKTSYKYFELSGNYSNLAWPDQLDTPDISHSNNNENWKKIRNFFYNSGKCTKTENDRKIM